MQAFINVFVIVLIQQKIPMEWINSNADLGKIFRPKPLYYSCDPPQKDPPKTSLVTTNMDMNSTCVRKHIFSITHNRKLAKNTQLVVGARDTI